MNFLHFQDLDYLEACLLEEKVELGLTSFRIGLVREEEVVSLLFLVLFEWEEEDYRSSLFELE